MNSEFLNGRSLPLSILRWRRNQMSLAGYNVRKAAQVVAFFAHQSGGNINVLKLSKLVYLADREFMSLYDMPILFDKLVSMDHGPVDSTTLNYISGFFRSDSWDDFVAARENYAVGLARNIDTDDDLDELSEAESEVLSVIWQKFGWMDKYALRDYTHEHCPEWEPSGGTSLDIPYARVFKFLGKSNTDNLSEHVDMIRAMSENVESVRRDLHSLQERDGFGALGSYTGPR